MKDLAVIFVVIFLLYSQAAFAEEVKKTVPAEEGKDAIRDRAKQLADKLCPIYAKMNEFSEIPKESLQPCEFYGDPYASGKNVSTKGKCLVQKVLGYKNPIKLSVVSELGTCHSSAIVQISEGDHPEVVDLEIVNSDVNGYGFGRDDRILNSSPHLVLVTNELHSDLRLVTSQGQYVLCGFRYQLKGYSVANWKNASVCEKFANDKFENPEEPRVNSVDGIKQADALSREALDRDINVEATSDVDLDGDGKPEKVLSLEYSSGAGCGCDRSGLSLAKSKDNATGAATLDQKLRELTDIEGSDCNTRVRWLPVVIDGKAYIAGGAALLKPLQKGDPWLYQTSVRKFPERILYKYENGNFVEECRLKPDTKKVIDKDVVPRYELGYTPLDDTAPE